MLSEAHSLFRSTLTKPVQRLLLSIMLSTGASAPIYADTVQFSVSRQPLSQALSEFSIQSGLQITAPSHIVEGKTTRALQGKLNAEAALTKLLEGTGLIAKRSGSSSFIITYAKRPTDAGLLREHIIVKGTKLESSLQDTKESIAVFTSETIQTRGLIDLSDALLQTAGASGSPRSFRIRGIDSGEVGTLRSELASLYIDGLALSGWVKTEGPQQLWDVEQVEVMRGPQSTNLGRNALAGAIVVKTHDPIYENSTKIRLGAGNESRREVAATGNLSLTDGISALRLTFEQTDTDGHTNNITRNEDDFAYDERQNARLKWLLEPNDDLRMVLSLQHIDNEYGDNVVAFEAPGRNMEDHISLADIRGRYDLEAVLASLTIDYQINDTWNVKSITAGLDGERDRSDDFDDSETDGGFIVRNADDENLSQEFRFNYQSEYIRGSSGIYYSKTKASNSNDTQIRLNLEDQINQQLAGISPGLGSLFVGAGLYPQFYDFNTGGNNRIETTNIAVFTEWEVDVANNWLLSFGLRFDREKQDVAQINLGSSDVTLPDPALGAFIGPGVDTAITLINMQLQALSTSGSLSGSDTDYEAVLPHLGITYHWSEDVSTSFFVKRGYRAGGTEITGLNTINAYDPEYLLNYELALRAVLFGGRAILNANLYYGDWDDQQVSIPELVGSTNNVFLILDNAGKSEIAGLEVDFRYHINDNLSVFTTAGYNHTEYKDFVRGTDDFSGNDFRFAPEVTATVGGNYITDNGLFVNLNLTYQGDSFADNANTQELDAHTVANLRAGYQSDSFRAELYATNLFDETYATDRFELLNGSGELKSFGTLGKPKEYGLRISYEL